MPPAAPSRASLDASRNANSDRSGAPASSSAFVSAARAATPPTKSFTKMLKSSVHGTLRAAGLTGTTTTTTTPTRNNDERTPRASTTDKESRTARGFRKLEDGINFVRTRRISLLRPSQPQPQPQPQPPTSPGVIINDDAGIGWAPFVSPSLRKASMSSPDLSTPATPRTTQHTRSQQQQQQQQQQHAPRQQQQRPPPISTRARDPQSISRPRPLIPASISSTSLPRSPDTPTRRNPSRNPPQTPTRRAAHSPPPASAITIMRLPSASASTSQLPQSSPSSPRHPVYPASPAHYRNTSSASLISSPYRESIRKASSLLVRELARPPQGIKPRDWEDVDIRLRSLVRLERVWGKSGGGSSTALATSSTMGGSEDRERRLFCETVRDGYVLCM